jgi:hypothetical protein
MENEKSTAIQPAREFPSRLMAIGALVMFAVALVLAYLDLAIR